ncbi:MAG TPA: DUF1444 family protein [Symbiobacteriaceae bacterium]|nr:DUF1444 family protein [Symbiobacteriaceae bacterium]
MGKTLLSATEFSRIIVSRVKKERPDIRVQTMGKSMLLVESEPGKPRVVSLEPLYQSYCDAPTARDEVIDAFLSALVYEEPGEVQGTFAMNRDKILPQVVPHSLLEFCRRERQELASLDYVGGLGIAFVVDEDERYAYIHRSVMVQWGIDEMALLQAAVMNLQHLSGDTGSSYRVGRGYRTEVVWETFDGYDASRILLKGELNEAAASLAGNPIIGIPHRDYMVMFGDTDPEFVADMQERIRTDFESHSYPITPALFTLVGGNLVPYDRPHNLERVVN